MTSLGSGSVLAACSSDEGPATAVAHADASAPDGSESSGGGGLPPIDFDASSGTGSSSEAGIDAGANDAGTGWSASFTGSVGAITPVIADAIAFNEEGYLTIKLTSYAGACTYEDADDEHLADSTYLELYLDTYPGAVGTLPIGTVDGTTAQAIYWQRDATCDDTQTRATSGSVTISAVGATTVAGSVALVFGGASYSGSFVAEICGTGAPTGSGGACIGAPASSTCSPAATDTACTVCDKASCCSQLSACASNAACLAYGNCVTGCTTQACQNECAITDAAGVAPFEAELTCLETSCATPCE
jgi:hypothetical protein